MPDIATAAPDELVVAPDIAATAPQPKTAVVLVHGIGEQVPLETIRSFVEGVYQHDLSLANHDTDERNMLRIAVVPDSATGSAELRRLTTQSDGPQKRADFFEFYWADIMEGTPVEQAVAWIDTLLLRAPWRVPLSVRVYLAWFLLWLLAAVVLFSAALTAYPDLLNSIAILPKALHWLSVHRVRVGQGLYVWGTVLFFWNWWHGMTARRRRVENVKFGLPAVLLLAGVGLLLVHSTTLIDARIWAGAFTALVAWAMHTYVGPYAGDVARYVRATPATVGQRKDIRERGVALLERLHARRLDDQQWGDFTQATADRPPYYDRIVVVGHSLGSIIAYDLVQLFWERYGPTPHVDWSRLASVPAMQRALRGADLYVRKVWVRRKPLREREQRAFLLRQERLAALLASDKPHWRISDLVTLGSPLAHAAFLMTDGDGELRQAFRERRFATTPPRPDPLLDSMLYRGQGPAGPLYPHFAAQFAAVRWTNLCDETPIPVFGDIISGRLAPIFGPGLVEHDVKITRPGLWWPLSRIFTHTEYWTWDDRYARGREPEHLKLLRQALRLGQ